MRQQEELEQLERQHNQRRATLTQQERRTSAPHVGHPSASPISVEHLDHIQTMMHILLDTLNTAFTTFTGISRTFLPTVPAVISLH